LAACNISSKALALGAETIGQSGRVCFIGFLFLLEGASFGQACVFVQEKRGREKAGDLYKRREERKGGRGGVVIP
jgi:hypothetical protein